MERKMKKRNKRSHIMARNYEDFKKSFQDYPDYENLAIAIEKDVSQLSIVLRTASYLSDKGEHLFEGVRKLKREEGVDGFHHLEQCLGTIYYLALWKIEEEMDLQDCYKNEDFVKTVEEVICTQQSKKHTKH